MWIDTNCSESFHEIKKNDQGQWVVVHADETICESCEFNVAELVA